MSTPDHHDLHHEFPEFNEAIHQLKVGNHHFAKLFDEYHHINREILTLEGKNVPVADETAEELKRRRLKLKDELYAMLVAHKPA